MRLVQGTCKRRKMRKSVSQNRNKVIKRVGSERRAYTGGWSELETLEGGWEHRDGQMSNMIVRLVGKGVI